MIKHPPLRYHGSKWRLAPWIISHFPTHRTYCEPFAGGAGVLLRKAPSEVEIYNDLDARVVNFFHVARNHPAELMTQLLLTPYARAEAVACREPSANPIEDARRSCAASWQLFGGGQGQWHTGFRVQRPNSANCTTAIWQRLPLQLPAVAARLRRVHIENLDALECIRRYDSPSTLFYLDPPYLPELRSNWRKTAYRHEATPADHAQLAQVLQQIAGMAIVSGYPSRLYANLYAGWTYVTTATRTDRGVSVTESLWISPNAAQVAQASLFNPNQIRRSEDNDRPSRPLHRRPAAHHGRACCPPGRRRSSIPLPAPARSRACSQWLPQAEFFGYEIEPEWADQARTAGCITTTGDSRHMHYPDAMFDAICTSPTYGNRMADHHEARDGSPRHTYRHVLGRPLTPGNSGALQWGEEYRALHVAVWTECRRVLKLDGIFVLNMKDHIRKGVLQEVTTWHYLALLELGFICTARVHVPCPGQRHGANGHLRVEYESVLQFTKVR